MSFFFNLENKWNFKIMETFSYNEALKKFLYFRGVEAELHFNDSDFKKKKKFDCEP